MTNENPLIPPDEAVDAALEEADIECMGLSRGSVYRLLYVAYPAMFAASRAAEREAIIAWLRSDPVEVVRVQAADLLAAAGCDYCGAQTLTAPGECCADCRRSLARSSVPSDPKQETPTFCSTPDCGLRATTIRPTGPIRWQPFCDDCVPSAPDQEPDA